MPELLVPVFLFSFFLLSGIAKSKFNKFLTPRNFYIFIHIAKKAGEDTTKNYTDHGR